MALLYSNTVQVNFSEHFTRGDLFTVYFCTFLSLSLSVCVLKWFTKSKSLQESVGFAFCFQIINVINFVLLTITFGIKQICCQKHTENPTFKSDKNIFFYSSLDLTVLLSHQCFLSDIYYNFHDYKITISCTCTHING